MAQGGGVRIGSVLNELGGPALKSADFTEEDIRFMRVFVFADEQFNEVGGEGQRVRLERIFDDYPNTSLKR
ncbi:hypothetical protein PC116_g19319 [Phytophthora cactorum]|uniref:Uncharacterized protein n=1 Tax=Phytophthora cactorum TaxID=29920 RepID=A0A8T1BJQ0_9STRA|nr:hypothetical protein PC113_g4318 [Phytophthora cactorum]KAG2905110.1 hypothetical protein PC115_g14737 [Phytophthora cactorum]KAG2908814.1 hypothetical protein PC114_g10286 [Phytophthora cactorum]KAG2950485.1 hypothetical protein PC117_g4405 [Phytophthora cactorum]KAG3002497.1 hypothetical protein PC119_g16294 [Phytophthora cactorum]